MLNWSKITLRHSVHKEYIRNKWIRSVGYTNVVHNAENEKPTNTKYKGLIYSVSSEIKKDIDLALRLVAHIYDGSGVMTRPDGEYETLIILNEKDKKRLTSKIDLTKVSFVLLDKFIKT